MALSGGIKNTQFLDTIKVANQINLPVTFEDPNTDYTMSDFGGNVSMLTLDPLNSNNHVMKATKTAGAQTYAGTTIGTGLGFSSLIPLTATSAKMTVMVYSPAAGIDVKLKLDDHTRGNTGFSVETDVLTTVANQWETLTFDFTKPAKNTPALKVTNKYDLATIFFDFVDSGNQKTASHWRTPPACSTSLRRIFSRAKPPPSIRIPSEIRPIEEPSRVIACDT